MSAPVVVLAFFMPDLKLVYVFLNFVVHVKVRADKISSDGQNLIEVPTHGTPEAEGENRVKLS